ncbi:MAG: hypothetical protein ACRDJH_18565 [Thermomicrobiales bacterium]
MIGYRNRREMGGWERPSMVFYGGFMDVGPATDPNAYVDYLALLYADCGAEFDDLEHRLGSIDIVVRSET